jgi:uncharacterized protein YbdZ (MbtH family)
MSDSSNAKWVAIFGRGADRVNPFEGDRVEYLVLINEEGQYSLWPATAEIPDGWVVEFGPVGRADCLSHIERNWTDLRPKSLRTSGAV